MAAGFFFGCAKFAAFRSVQRGFRFLAHLRDFGIVALHEIALILQEAARGLIVAFADNLFLLFRRGVLAAFSPEPFWLCGGGTFGLGFAVRFLARRASLCSSWRRATPQRRRVSPDFFALDFLALIFSLWILGFGFPALAFFALAMDRSVRMGGELRRVDGNERAGFDSFQAALVAAKRGSLSTLHRQPFHQPGCCRTQAACRCDGRCGSGIGHRPRHRSTGGPAVRA